jgi:hypothetical protein
VKHIIGRWAVDTQGFLGKVNMVRQDPVTGLAITSGITPDSKPWSSTDPRYLSAQESDRLDEVLEHAWAYEDLQ